MNIRTLTLAVAFLTATISLFAQKEEWGISFYLKSSANYNYKFKLNSTLSNIGYKKIPNIFTFGLIGISYDIKKKVEIAFEGGVGGMGYGKKTRIINSMLNLSGGYILTLPKENRLIFAGNFALDEYNVYAYKEKGNLDFQNSVLLIQICFICKCINLW